MVKKRVRNHTRKFPGHRKNQSGEPRTGTTRGTHALRMGARGPVYCASTWGRVQAPKKFLKIWRRSWRRIGLVGIFVCQNWVTYEKLLSKLGYVRLINDCAVISHIGETHPEDERNHARHGGYDPATYQWVGNFFVKPIYILWFSQNQFLNEKYVFIVMHILRIDARIIINSFHAYVGAEDAQVSAR